jgi:serine/threonine-protein kinase
VDVIRGTMGYMSPEQLRGAEVEPPSDIFSLGCVLYEMVSGTRAFGGQTAPEIFAKILTEPPSALPEIVDIPIELNRLIGRCLEKDASQRYQSAPELKVDLEALLTGTEIKVAAQKRTIDSIAVLPLENVGGDAEMEYFSDGVTESIISNLSQLPQLRVIARSTVFRYKGKSLDPQRVGRELNVRAVLTGRLVQRGERLSMTLELVEATDGRRLWGERYSRPLAEIFDVETEVASEISRQLRVALTREQKKRLAKRHTQDREAYQLYLKGRFYWNKRAPEALFKSIPFFEGAIERDPTYALAYSGLADTYSVLASTSLVDPLVLFPKAKAAAMRAIELDNNLAEAHTSLVIVKIYFDWDWEAVEREAEQATRLNPNYATVHHWLSVYLCARGRYDQALAEIRRAQELDPLSLVIDTHVAWVLYFSRRYDEAIQHYLQILKVEPGFVRARYLLGATYLEQAMYDEAIAEIGRAIEITSRGSTEMIAALACALARAGRRADAESLLEELMVTGRDRFVSPYDIATIYVSLNDPDRAFEWLEKAYQGRLGWMVGLAADPRVDPIRADPRFADLLRRMHLDQPPPQPA